MLATIIIVLREMLEACLIVGIVFSTLKTLSNRLSLLFLGISGGIGFSVILALIFYKFSNLFDGNGQEIFNIIILTTSIICISLTIIWVNKHAHELRERILKASTKQGILPIILVISLAISREGAELTLFLHGIAASGVKTTELILGSTIGFIIGTALGILMYKGLLKIPTRYFFKIINIMLILLGSGMSAEIANYLTASDLVESLSTNIWNSSWLILDSSVTGKILHGLIGYHSQPSELQVVFYFSTLLLMLLITKVSKTKSI